MAASALIDETDIDELFMRSMSFPEKILLFLELEHDLMHWDPTGTEVVINEVKFTPEMPKIDTKLADHLPLCSLSCMVRLFKAHDFKVERTLKKDTNEVVTICSHPRFLKEGLPSAPTDEDLHTSHQMPSTKLGVINTISTEIELEAYQHKAPDKGPLDPDKEGDTDLLKFVIEEAQKKEVVLVPKVASSVVQQGKIKRLKGPNKSKCKAKRSKGKQTAKSKRKVMKSKNKDTKATKSKSSNSKRSKNGSEANTSHQQRGSNMNLQFTLNPNQIKNQMFSKEPMTNLTSTVGMPTLHGIPHSSTLKSSTAPPSSVVFQQNVIMPTRQLLPNLTPMYSLINQRLVNPMYTQPFQTFFPTFPSIVPVQSLPTPQIMRPQIPQLMSAIHMVPPTIQTTHFRHGNITQPFSLVSPFQLNMANNFQYFQPHSDPNSGSGLVFPSSNRTGNYVVKLINKDNSEELVQLVPSPTEEKSVVSLS